MQGSPHFYSFSCLSKVLSVQIAEGGGVKKNEVLAHKFRFLTLTDECKKSHVQPGEVSICLERNTVHHWKLEIAKVHCVGSLNRK